MIIDPIKEEGEESNHLIYMDERIICLFKNVEDQDGISGKKRNDL